MGLLIETLQSVREFLIAGGYVLIVIGCLTWLMWFLIVERVLYFTRNAKDDVNAVINTWLSRSDRHSWYAHQIRQKLAASISIKTHYMLSTIRTIVMICPLLGLLGTVSGMIEVFEALTQGESENIRSIAAGFSKAIISTLAGLVSALSGLIAINLLYKKASQINHQLTNVLVE